MRRTGLTVLLLLLLVPGAAIRGEEPPAASPEDVTPDERDKGLLRAFRALDDSLGRQNDAFRPRAVFADAVAGWAYLLASDRGGRRLPPRRSQLGQISSRLARYVEAVDRSLERRAGMELRPDAPPEERFGAGGMAATQYCWPIAMTAFFFSECAARGVARREAKPSLIRIVRILESAQQENGGWGHNDEKGIGGMPLPVPDPTGRRARLDYPKTLFATTNAAAPAVAIARRTLRKEPGESVARARTYFSKFQSKNGSLPYDPSQKAAGDMLGRMPPGQDGLGSVRGIFAARTAGGVFAMLGLGAGLDDPVVERAIAFVGDDLKGLSEGHGSASYGLLLAALAQRARGEVAWTAFRSTFFRRLLEVQQKSGAFRCACRKSSPGTTCDSELPGGMSMPGYLEGSEVYVTAIHTLVLVLDRTRPRVLPKPPVPRRPARTEPPD